MSDGAVLIVDDEPDMVENSTRILRRAGYRCSTATDPHRALSLLDAWPGNVRELQNVVERACALADGPSVRRRDLPEYVLAREGLRATTGSTAVGVDPRLPSTEGLSLTEARERWLTVLEADYLRSLLDRHDGNISSAAKAAGIDRKTFHRLVTKHQIR